MTPAVPSSTLHIYTRVSTVAQADKGTSLESQLELGSKKAKELGFAVEHWDEGGKSSHHEDIAGRPVLFRLFSAIKQGQVKHLWVYDQSRLSRNDQVASLFRYECDKQGVTLYTKDGRFDLSNPNDKFMKQLLDAVAEFDNATRAERTRLGKVNRVRSGNWHGGPPPYGYALKDKRLVIQPEEAKWVKRMFKESLAGESPAKIKLLLDSHGVLARRGGLWSIGSIAALLKNQHYTGQYAFKDKKGGQEIDVQCPAIVPLEVWQGVQLAHFRGPNRAHQQAATTRHFYLLRDVMFCGHCGRPMSGRRNASKGEALYYCPNKERSWARTGKSEKPWKRGTGCGFDRSMNIERADELVWRFITDIHSKSSLLKEEVKQRVLQVNGLNGAAPAKAAVMLQGKVRRLQKQMQGISEAIGNLEASRLLSKLDETAYQSAMRKLNEAHDGVHAELNDVQLELQGLAERKKWIDWVDAFGAEIKGASALEDAARHDYLKGIVDRIDVFWDSEAREHRMDIHFKLPIVGDALRWRDARKKSLGYEVVEGTRNGTLPIPKKDRRG